MTGQAVKGRSDADSEVLYGCHPVAEALAAGRRRIYRLVVDRKVLSGRQARIVQLAEKRRIGWETQPSARIGALCGSDHHQGVAATVSPLPIDPLASTVASALYRGRSCLLVLLDSIVDPNNLGAIVRSAHCAGADALIIPKDRAARATPAVSKASAGAIEHMRLCRVTNLASTILWLKAQEIWVAGLAMQADRTVFETDLKGRLALVVGSEEKGLRPLIRRHCDYLISIPLCGRVDSLNASAATAVVLYEAFRQRHPVG